MTKYKNMQLVAQELRVKVIEMIYKAGSGHSGGSLSIAEILTVLYQHTMNVLVENPGWEDRDRFILSKGMGHPLFMQWWQKRVFLI